MRTAGAIARLGAVALVLGIVVRAALAAAWSPAQVTAALGAAIVVATAAALVLLADARRARYATDAGERDADRALAASWPDDHDLDPGDCR